jgi:hypothetical protein
MGRSIRQNGQINWAKWADQLGKMIRSIGQNGQIDWTKWVVEWSMGRWAAHRWYRVLNKVNVQRYRHKLDELLI